MLIVAKNHKSTQINVEGEQGYSSAIFEVIAEEIIKVTTAGLLNDRAFEVV